MKCISNADLQQKTLHPIFLLTSTTFTSFYYWDKQGGEWGVHKAIHNKYIFRTFKGKHKL